MIQSFAAKIDEIFCPWFVCCIFVINAVNCIETTHTHKSAHNHLNWTSTPSTWTASYKHFTCEIVKQRRQRAKRAPILMRIGKCELTRTISSYRKRTKSLYATATNDENRISVWPALKYFWMRAQIISTHIEDDLCSICTTCTVEMIGCDFSPKWLIRCSLSWLRFNRSNVYL